MDSPGASIYADALRYFFPARTEPSFVGLDYAAIVDRMQRSFGDADELLACCDALIALLRGDVNRGSGDEGRAAASEQAEAACAMPAVLAAVNAHPHHERLAAAVMVLLVGLTFSARTATTAFELGAAQVATTMLRTHIGSAHMTFYASLLLTEITNEIESLSQVGAVCIHPLTDALLLHPGELRAQHQGFILFAKLCELDVDNARRAYEAGVQPLAVAAAHSHGCSYAFFVLSRTVHHSGCFSDDAALAAVRAGALPVVLQALQKTENKDDALLDYACRFLSHLAQCSPETGICSACGACQTAIPALLALMKAHMRDGELLRQILVAVISLVQHDPEHAVTALRAGILPILQAVRRAQAADAELVAGCAGVEAMLHDTQSTANAAADAAAAALLAELDAEAAAKPAAAQPASKRKGKSKGKKRGGAKPGGAGAGGSGAAAAADEASDADEADAPPEPLPAGAAVAAGAGGSSKSDSSWAFPAPPAAAPPPLPPPPPPPSLPAPSSADAAGGGASLDTHAAPCSSASCAFPAPPALPPSAAPRRGAPRPYRPPMGDASSAAGPSSVLPPHASCAAAAAAAAVLPAQLAELALGGAADAQPLHAMPPAAQASLPMRECCICLADVPLSELLLLLPCAHRCVCQGCTDALLAGSPRCPKCRASVAHACRIFED